MKVELSGELNDGARWELDNFGEGGTYLELFGEGKDADSVCVVMSRKQVKELIRALKLARKKESSDKRFEGENDNV